MCTIYSRYTFSNLIDKTVLKPGMDESLLKTYSKWLDIEYVDVGLIKSKTKIIIKPKLEELLKCKCTIDLLYERFDSLIYDMERQEIISISIPEYSPRKTLDNIIQNYSSRCADIQEKGDFQVTEYIRGYTFHLFAEPMDYNSSLNDAIQNLNVFSYVTEDSSEPEWEFCDESLSDAYNVETIEENVNEHYIWNILPDEKIENRMRLQWIILEFFNTFTEEYQKILDPEMSYIVRFQHPHFHSYCTYPHIYILDVFRKTSELDLMKENVWDLKAYIDKLREDSIIKDIPFAFPVVIDIGSVSKKQILSIIDNLDIQVPGITIEDTYYNDKIVVFNDKFYRKNKYFKTHDVNNVLGNIYKRVGKYTQTLKLKINESNIFCCFLHHKNMKKHNNRDKPVSKIKL